MQAPGRRSRTLMPHAHRSASALGRRLSSHYIGLQQSMQISTFDSIGGEIFDFLADCTHNLFPAFCTHIQVPSSAAVGMLGTRDVASAGKPVKQNKFGRDGPLLFAAQNDARLSLIAIIPKPKRSGYATAAVLCIGTAMGLFFQG